MIFIDASCPSKSDAAVTIRTLCFGLYGAICSIRKNLSFYELQFTDNSKKLRLKLKYSKRINKDFF
jgi:hypothetical protein